MKINLYASRAVALAALAAVALLTSLQPLHAGTMYTYETVNAKNGGESVSAQVTIEISNNLIQVHLTDTSSFVQDMGQVLTGVSIALSGNPTGAHVTGSSADVVIVTDGGGINNYGTNPIFGNSITLTSDDLSLPAPDNPYGGWTMGGASNSNLALSAFGTKSPNFGVLDATQMIFPANGAGSIVGNGPHNPFSRGTANFSVGYTGGVSSATQVTGVTFQFGTSQGGGFITGTNVPTPVPEPTSLALWSVVISAMGLRRLRAKNKNNFDEATSS